MARVILIIQLAHRAGRRSRPATQPAFARTKRVARTCGGSCVRTWPQLVKLLHIPKRTGWRSADLTSWEIGAEVNASRSFANTQTTGSFTTIMTAIDSWGVAGASTQSWTAAQDAAAKQPGVTVLSRTANQSVLYGVGQYNQRGVTLNILLGPWSVGAGCYTNKPKVSVAALTACAKKTAKAQQKKSAPVVAPG